MMVESKDPKMYSNLILIFERETNLKAVYRDKISEQFEYWINKKLDITIFICKDPNGCNCGRAFHSKHALGQHKSWNMRFYKVASRNNNITKFFSSFLNEHVYFTKNQLVASYIEVNKPLKENHTKIRKELLQLAYHLSRIGILANYTKFT